MWPAPNSSRRQQRPQLVAPLDALPRLEGQLGGSSQMPMPPAGPRPLPHEVAPLSIRRQPRGRLVSELGQTPELEDVDELGDLGSACKSSSMPLGLPPVTGAPSGFALPQLSARGAASAGGNSGFGGFGPGPGGSVSSSAPSGGVLPPMPQVGRSYDGRSYDGVQPPTPSSSSVASFAGNGVAGLARRRVAPVNGAGQRLAPLAGGPLADLPSKQLSDTFDGRSGSKMTPRLKPLEQLGTIIPHDDPLRPSIPWEAADQMQANSLKQPESLPPMAPVMRPPPGVGSAGGRPIVGAYCVTPEGPTRAEVEKIFRMSWQQDLARGSSPTAAAAEALRRIRSSSRESASWQEEAKPEAEAKDEDAPVELTEEEKKVWHRKQEISDLSQDMLAASFGKFSMPTKADGFDEVRFEWDKEASATKLFTEYVMELKRTTKVHDLPKTEWFKENWTKWKKEFQTWKAKQQEWKKKNPGSEAAEVDEDLDVMAVENIDDIGNEEPLYVHFAFEDWVLLAARYELHLLVHSYRKALEDPDRPTFAEKDLNFYYQMHFGRHFTPSMFSCEDLQDLCEKFVDQTIKVAENGHVEACFPDSTEQHYFVKLTEDYRRERERRVDAGDETAKISFPKARPAVSQAPGKRPPVPTGASDPAKRARR